MAEAFKNFIPGGTLTVAASAVTANGQLVTNVANSPQNRRDVLLYNPPTNSLAFFKFGDSTVTATTSDTPLPPGAYAIFHAADATYIAVILASGTGSIYATSGFGN